MGFTYGDMKFESQFASVTIGRLKCRGQKKLKPNEVTASCSSLKQSGVTQSGNYLMKDEKVSFCDMTKTMDDNDIEMHVGDLTYKDVM